MTDLDARSRKHSAEPAGAEFTVAIRGYDRTQVDEYIEQLLRRLANAEARAHNAEAEFIFDEHAAIGPRVTEIFALAEAEARDLRDRVGSLVGDARNEAQAIIDAAERAAGKIRERAEREHVVMFAELEQERERIRGEVAVLERRKADAIGELHRLREALGAAAGVPEPGAPEPQAREPQAREPHAPEPHAREPQVPEPIAELDGRAANPTRPISGSDETVELPAVTVEIDET